MLFSFIAPNGSAERAIEGSRALIDYLGGQGLTSEVEDFEAQQRVFDADPNDQLLAIGADAALTYFRWVLARRIEAGGTRRGRRRGRAAIGLGPAPDLA